MKKLSGLLSATSICSLIGAILFVGTMVWAWSSRQAVGMALPTKGDAKLTLPVAGTYTLWHEERALRNGQFLRFSESYPAGVQVTFQKLPEVTEMPLQETAPRVFETAATRRTAMAELAIPSAGEVQVLVVAPPGQSFYLSGPPQMSGEIIQVMVVGTIGLLLFVGGIVAEMGGAPRRSAEPRVVSA